MKKLLLLSAIVLATLSQAQNYDFEAAQGYTPGPLSGQNSWGATGPLAVATVSTAQANPGLQSLKLTGNNGTVHTAQGPISPSFTVSGPEVNIVFNAFFETALTAGDECDFFFSPQSPTEATINARMHFTYQNKIRVIYTNPITLAVEYIDTGATFTRNSWSSYRIQLNFATDVANYYKDGVLIFTGDVIGGTLVGNLAITNDNYNSSAFFDGIQITSGSLSTSETNIESDKLSIYPNPTADFLNIKTEGKVKSILVYDMAGRAMDVKVSDKKVDVRALQTGAYIINVETSTGKTTEKFIKK